MRLKYKNPYASRTDFIPLGLFTTANKDPVVYELYALTDSAIRGEINLGARYNNEPSSYLSGFIIKKGFKDYEVMGPLPVVVAAARYFAMKFDETEAKLKILDNYREAMTSIKLTPEQIEELQQNRLKASLRTP